MRSVEVAAQDPQGQPVNSRRRVPASTLPPDDDDIALVKAYWPMVRRNPHWLHNLFGIDARRLTAHELTALIEKLK